MIAVHTFDARHRKVLLGTRATSREAGRLATEHRRAAPRLVFIAPAVGYEWCRGCGGYGTVRTAPDDRDECPSCEGRGTHPAE